VLLAAHGMFDLSVSTLSATHLQKAFIEVADGNIWPSGVLKGKSWGTLAQETTSSSASGNGRQGFWATSGAAGVASASAAGACALRGGAGFAGLVFAATFRFGFLAAGLAVSFFLAAGLRFAFGFRFFSGIDQFLSQAWLSALLEFTGNSQSSLLVFAFTNGRIKSGSEIRRTNRRLRDFTQGQICRTLQICRTSGRAALSVCISAPKCAGGYQEIRMRGTIYFSVTKREMGVAGWHHLADFSGDSSCKSLLGSISSGLSELRNPKRLRECPAGF
jgi:hypothetical protein